MLIPKSERKKIHEYLFREGVLVAKKEFESQHNDIDTKNLYVRRPMPNFGTLKRQPISVAHVLRGTEERKENVLT